MESDELAALLRESEPTKAAELLAEMEPDEAAEALRDLDDETRDEILAEMDPEDSTELAKLTEYDEESAGGVMTTTLYAYDADLSVADVRTNLAALDDGDIARLESVLVLDSDGALLDDILVVDLFMARDDDTLRSLIGSPWPVTVGVGDALEDVIEAFVENRGSSIVVVDDDGRPVGRILADDVVDALLSDERDHQRRRFTGILN